jgi:hypothetical protein
LGWALEGKMLKVLLTISPIIADVDVVPTLDTILSLAEHDKVRP